MWIIPSRNRPELVQRIFSVVTPTAPGVIAIDDDQTDLYAGVSLPPNWKIVATPRKCFGPKNNEILAMFPGHPFYGSMNDDMLPRTPGWDTELPRLAGPWGIAWADDALGKRAGCLAFGGKLIEALGWLCCPVLQHFYNDDAHELIMKDLNVGCYCPGIKVPHLHFSNGKAKHDQTYAERPSAGIDQIAFASWKANEWPAIRDRVKAGMPC